MKTTLIAILTMFMVAGCGLREEAPKSSSGVKKASVKKLPTNAQGFTVEQQNVMDRLELDNAPGSIKHLYIFSSYSGDTLLYSTVRGKVTSSGKRLTPVTVKALDGDHVSNAFSGFSVNIGGSRYQTEEVLQDDGTYGTSIPYLYWFDERGSYHQHYVSGGQIVHVSNTPIRVRKPIVNIEMVAPEATPEGYEE